MEIVKHLYLENNEKEAFQKKPCVIAMGTFDGLHKGHRDVIDAAAAYALSRQDDGRHRLGGSGLYLRTR